MFGHSDAASFVEGLKDPETGEFSSNFKLLTISAAFLVVTIGLILMQPGYAPEEITQIETPIEDLANAPEATVVEPSPQPVSQPQAETVTRLDTSLFSVTQNQAGIPVPLEPIQIPTGPFRTNNLQSLVKTSLSDFGHVVRQGDYLHGLLVTALAEGHTETSIDAMVNSAVASGDIKVPMALQSYAGRLDTQTLLQAIKTRVRLN